MTAAIEISTFADHLMAAARRYDVTKGPFISAVLRGTAPRDALRMYALRISASGCAFPRILGAVLGVCDDDRVRRHLIGNLLEEEGIVGFGDGHDVVADRERAHGTLARRFARAAGASQAEVDALPVLMARWFREALDEGNWIGPFAFFGVGHEANVPAAFRTIAPALEEHYGFTPHDLTFLTEHFEADERHGREAAELVSAVATTETARQQALEGARRGGSAFAELHRIRV